MTSILETDTLIQAFQVIFQSGPHKCLYSPPEVYKRQIANLIDQMRVRTPA